MEAAWPPHRSRYWLNAKTKAEDPVAFAAQMGPVCTGYAYAPMLEALGCHGVSTAALPGVQARERRAPTMPRQPGRAERREFAYLRHGTRSLIATGHVATGQVLAPSLGPTRTEEDFAAHIRRTVATDPGASGLFLTDQRTTHQSAALGRRVAEHAGLTEELGVHGQSGLLQSRPTRAAFRSDPAAIPPTAANASTSPSTPPGATRANAGAASSSGASAGAATSPPPTPCASASSSSSPTSTNPPNRSTGLATAAHAAANHPRIAAPLD